MKTIFKNLVLVASLCALLPVFAARADDDSFAPGGTAIDRHTERFHDQKVIMDLKAMNIDSVKYGTMIASRLIENPGMQLAVIIEGPFVSVFAKKDYLDHQGIVDQWAELAKKGVHVEFCGNSIQTAGLKPADMVGLSEKNPATVNAGAYPSIVHFESLGYALIVPLLMPNPAPAPAPAK